MRPTKRPHADRARHRLARADADELIKPRLRGWSHAVATLGAIGVTILLLRATADDLPRFGSCLVFGLSLIILYSISAIYHLGDWRGRVATALRTWDHANIFLLIAGTYTPITVNVLSGPVRLVILIGIWLLAAAGMASALFTLHLPRWALAGLYVGMGWVGLLALPHLLRALPVAATLLLLSGGLLYTIGALIYAFRRPNPWPRSFGFHEIFHLCVIAGSAATVAMIVIWVVPFPRS